MRPFYLLLVVEDSGDDDVFESLAGIEAESLRDSLDPLGSKIPFGVHVYSLHLTSMSGQGNVKFLDV